jgi:hypothetical protein
LDTGRIPGGILRLLDYVQSHPKELAYDFRSRFQISFFEFGKSVSWAEAILLTASLMNDPSSHLQAAVNKWKHPVTYEWIVLTHVFDLLAMANSKRRPKPYPTPWPTKGKTRLGSNNKSRADVIKALRKMNPKDD